MRRFFPLVLLVLSLAAANAAPIAKVVVRYDPKVPTLEFATGELKNALSTAKMAPIVVPSLKGKATSGWTMIAGLQTELKAISPALGKIKLSEEGFAIRPVGKTIYVVGADKRGAMYGVLDITEHIEMGGALSTVKAKVEKPAVQIRSLKINMPGWDSLVIEKEWEDDWDWFLKPDYWRSYFDMMARNRYNISTIWHSHPYAWMAKIAKYPEAQMLTDAEMERFHKAFAFIFAEAARHGIDTYLITWNIHYPPKFAKAHNLEAAGKDTPEVRDYTREAIKAVLREYPGLTGIGTCPGENMPGTSEQNEAWLLDTYVPAILSVRGPQKFIHRYWGSEPKPMQQVFAAQYPGRVYLDLKFNGESMYTSPNPHFVDPEWLNQKPRNYDILWHLRNDDIYVTRWGDASFARATLKHCVGPGIAGFVTGSEYERPGPDRMYTEYAKQYQTWQQDFEKHWTRFMMWGKLSYDLNLPDSYFRQVFATRFGKTVGPKLYDLETTSSKIIPLVDSFHWNYMNFDWAGEACMTPSASVNTARDGKGRNPNYRELGQYLGTFNNIREWMFNWTIDDDEYIGIPEYVGNLMAGVKKGSNESAKITPPEVAEALDSYADAIDAGLSAMKLDPKQPGYKEAMTWCWDLRILSDLAHYYADKTRGGTDLLYYWCTGDAVAQQRAISALTNAKGHWMKLAVLGDKIYTFPKMSIYPRMQWSRYNKDVEQDVAFAQGPPAFKLNPVSWSAVDTSRPKVDDVEHISTTEVDLSNLNEPRFRIWLDMVNRKSRFVNLRQLWPDRETGTAALRYELPQTDKVWCTIYNDLGSVHKLWCGEELIYDAAKQSPDALKKGVTFMMKPSARLLTAECVGLKGLDWGCSLRPEFQDTYDMSYKVTGSNKVAVTVKNHFPDVPMTGAKITPIPWEPGWEVSPGEVTVDIKDKYEQTFTLKQVDPASKWTGITVRASYGNESRSIGVFTPLPGLNATPTFYNDGRWRAELVDGKWAMVTNPKIYCPFVYFNVADDYLYEIDQDVTITLEYYDTGELTEIYAEYDSRFATRDAGAYHRAVAKAVGVKGWQKISMKLPRARFANREHKADLRISAKDNPIAVRMIEVKK